MDETPEEKGLLARIPAPRAVRTLGRVGKMGARKMGARVQKAGQKIAKRLAHEMIQPEQITAIQGALARFAQWGMERGFALDPNAALFFEFLDWVDAEYGREAVMTRLMLSPMFQDPAFLEAITRAAALLSPFAPPSSETWGVDEVERLKDRAGQRLLELLVSLTELATETPAPASGTVASRQDYIADAPIPERFRVLATMAVGEGLDPAKPAPATRASSALRDLSQRLDRSGKGQHSLTRFVPGLGDAHLHFLVFSTTFVMQSYLLRHLVESLPEMAARLRELEPHDLPPQR
ncbi:hypothetical protein DV096_01510 [Bradymonadaceae bacterium TMQ3]|uniref:DUF1631 family protein n=1 Tax=Lujinxingia sediminis TaxID=2480984 RepID=A0ABY0CXR0_9DELT|nr:hypothetical protein [Lujinxingia sediminis]RDV39279.1 hypothetical protein DV096_01510 [Bradymonadaceae bacterium TMQ3]RVU48682.1 hypothetical protein EA187_04425 [Lujinxingia sediminis]TXC77975.1 hypothetical protein FRC91_04390 [Bradymonadales bacterium TMQ1]